MSTSIRLGFSTSPTWNPISAGIRSFTGGQTTHAYVVYQDVFRSCEIVMEASWYGFRDIPYESWKADNKVVAEFAFDDQLIPGVQWATKQLGTPYDYPGLLGMIPVSIGGWLHHKWNNPFQSAKASFCSEISCRMLQASSIPFAMQLEPTTLSPAKLMQACLDAKVPAYYPILQVA